MNVHDLLGGGASSAVPVGLSLMVISFVLGLIVEFADGRNPFVRMLWPLSNLGVLKGVFILGLVLLMLGLIL
jgi:hypothetical protein